MKDYAIALAVLLASSASFAHADETPDVDKSLGIFANSILGKWQPLPGAVSNETPDVDKSLARFASSILGGAKRLPEAVNNSKPDVDKSLAMFASSILN